jgi:hypothetical protein
LTGCVTLRYGKRNVCDVRGTSSEAARGAVLLEQVSAEGEPDPVARQGDQEGDAGGRAAARGCAGYGQLVEEVDDQAVAGEVRVVPFSPWRRWCCFTRNGATCVRLFGTTEAETSIRCRDPEWECRRSSPNSSSGRPGIDLERGGASPEKGSKSGEFSSRVEIRHRARV